MRLGDGSGGGRVGEETHVTLRKHNTSTKRTTYENNIGRGVCSLSCHMRDVVVFCF
jgi:hypothetical protein